jgi:hypothetical protein
MGTVAINAADEALANVGVVEVGDNRGTAVEIYQSSTIPPVPPGSPWCAAFVVYRLRRAAQKLGIVIPASWPRSAYCPAHGAWARKHGYWISVAEAEADPSLITKGDLVCFWFAPLNRLAHIGIVTVVHPWGIKSVEGNTSPEMEDEDQIQRDGDGVYRKARAWRELGINGGFIKIPW